MVPAVETPDVDRPAGWISERELRQLRARVDFLEALVNRVVNRVESKVGYLFTTEERRNLGI